MAYIKKEIRERIYLKYGKKCAYCGKDLVYKQMQVDHIVPHWHNIDTEKCKQYKLTKGEHIESNFNPSCARCNKRKDTFTIETFREELSKQCDRLLRDSNQYKLALDYGMIIETKLPIVFWFEKYPYIT